MSGSPLPDLTWRRFRPADAAAWAELINAMDAVDGCDDHVDEQGARDMLGDPCVDLENATLAVFDGATMVGFSIAAWRPPVDGVHRVALNGGVRPGFRRRGLGTRLLHAGIADARGLHARRHPDLRLVLDAWKGETLAGWAELLDREGFRPVRYFQHMEHPLGPAIPAASPTAGYTLEPWSEATDEEFRQVRNEAFQDHWGSAPTPEDAWRVRVSGSHLFRPGVSFLARETATGEPAAMLVAFDWSHGAAHFALIGTARGHRRRGLAAALITRALTASSEHGFDRVGLEVDSEGTTGAFGLYERLGFRTVRRSVRRIREIDPADGSEV